MPKKTAFVRVKSFVFLMAIIISPNQIFARTNIEKSKIKTCELNSEVKDYREIAGKLLKKDPPSAFELLTK